MFDIKRKENENEEQYIWRLGQAKDNGLIQLGWSEIAQLINKEFRADETEYMGESAYRKLYQSARRFEEAGVFEKSTSRIDDIMLATCDLKRARQSLSDERTALNKIIRESARSEDMLEIMKRAIDERSHFQYETPRLTNVQSDCDFIIHLTDIHCGMEVTNPMNTFNKDILVERMKSYLAQIKKNVELYSPQSAYVILGGDMIHGLIHVNARLESKENVVKQIIEVADVISVFIHELSKMFNGVEVYTTAGNHSRICANKELVSHGENLDLLVTHICKRDFRNVNTVKFVDNYLDYDIATFKVRGHMVYATHGDKDSARTVVANMTKFARKAKMPLPDICFLGHRHTNGLTTVDDVKVVESGCVGGMDNFAIDSRLVGSPEQAVIVTSEESVIQAFCDIQL